MTAITELAAGLLAERAARQAEIARLEAGIAAAKARIAELDVPSADEVEHRRQMQAGRRGLAYASHWRTFSRLELERQLDDPDSTEQRRAIAAEQIAEGDARAEQAEADAAYWGQHRAVADPVVGDLAWQAEQDREAARARDWRRALAEQTRTALEG